MAQELAPRFAAAPLAGPSMYRQRTFSARTRTNCVRQAEYWISDQGDAIIVLRVDTRRLGLSTAARPSDPIQEEWETVVDFEHARMRI